MKHAIYKDDLKGVSTLDIMKNSLKFLLFLVILTTFSTNIYSRRGHSTLDLIDPSFNPRVESAQYGQKTVHRIQSLANGKILAIGDFSSYNRVPVGKVVRLNADGSLDSSFYTQALVSIDVNDSNTKFLLQPNGKIVVMNRSIVVTGQAPKRLVRLNADGTYDTGFNFNTFNALTNLVIDSLGRIVVSRNFQQGTSPIIRLNDDGSIDNSFNFTLAGNTFLHEMAAQDNRLIVFTGSGSSRILYRLNDDGSPDTTFTPVSLAALITNLTIQADNKIIYINDKVRRLNADGSVDNGFQPITVPTEFGTQFLLKIADDDKIVVARGLSGATFYRFLSNGVPDPSFNTYTTTESYSESFTIQPDGGIVIADKSNPNRVIPINNFVRLKPDNGAPDPAFNPGGVGFQTILPGGIRTIEAQTDGKILLGGKFDLINDDSTYRLARLNADSTIDESFQINRNAPGNYFSVIRDIYQIRVQSDGKVVVSGSFDYVINGVTKNNFVRLNTDGTIDNTFVLSEIIPDYVEVNQAGRNRFLTLDGGKVMIGTSRLSTLSTNGPLKFNNNGVRDISFNSAVNAQSSYMYIDDLAIQPDGKIIVGGTHFVSGIGVKSFIARLNADGSLDSTFLYAEEPGRIKSQIAVLPGGKIMIAKHSDGFSAATVQRLNSDGSTDASFNTLSLPNGVINALLALPNGKLFVGGKFTITFNSQVHKNLLRLSADGNFEPTVYNINEEVLCLTVDIEGRLLVGGGFTVIGANGSSASRSYVARFTDLLTRFDFDGDGRADIGTFGITNGLWKILNSRSNQQTSTIFGYGGSDKTATADYDADGKADVAVFRPSDGVWYLLRSSDGFTGVQWGISEDKSAAADYDGDGKADVAVWRPSNGVWYIRQSMSGQALIVQFGMSGDIPLTNADFDGDGRADIAVWRPSNGVFYWLASGSNFQFRAVQFGLAADIPVVGDFNGDGKTDLVVFRPSEGNWYLYLTQSNGGYAFSVFTFGQNGDEPVAADYDGDGKTDITVRRQNIWHIMRSGAGYTALAFGDSNDQAVASSPNR